VTKRYGATEQEWFFLEFTAELTEDLLPVVANPAAKISPNSKMKEKGKTPSRYSAKREVVGFLKWTGYKATSENIGAWSKEPDYSACIQSRYARALDFDLKTNHSTVQDFVDKYCLDNFGFVLPIRTRVDSSKYLMIYKLKGEYAKRVVKTASGIIENLNNGQQFLLFGTHPEGQRYQLDMRGHKDFPELIPEQYEALWKTVCDKFGIEKPSEGHIRKKGETTISEDEVVQYLDVKGVGKDGQLFIDCPFKHEHTMDGGEAETCYFPAGTGGYAQGHIKCYHGHCQHRTDSDFLDALGVTDKIVKFEPILIEPMSNGKVPLADQPNLERDKKGTALLTESNLHSALGHAESLGYIIRYDSFLSAVMITKCDGVKAFKRPLRPFEDKDYFAIKLRLGKMNFKTPIRTEMLREALEYVAYKNKFDSAQEWINGLPEHDGVPRIDNFLPQAFGTEDTEYSRAIGRYWWTAQAGRVLTPGVKADMMPILEGMQGYQKSWSLKAMLPNEKLYGNINLSAPDEKNIRLMSGKLLCETDEVKGLHNRDLGGIKSFLTITVDEHIPKFKEKSKQSPRRCVFVGTTNEKELLSDTTGNRRFLPIMVTKADREYIKANRDQLWAEAKAAYVKDGVFWQAEKYSSEAHKNYRQREVWEEDIAEWLYTADEVDGKCPADKEYLTTKEILDNAVRLDISKKDPRAYTRVAKAMTDLGYEQKKPRIDRMSTKVWVKKDKVKNIDDLL
jgi:hypothetical protein